MFDFEIIKIMYPNLVHWVEIVVHRDIVLNVTMISIYLPV